MAKPDPLPEPVVEAPAPVAPVEVPVPAAAPTPVAVEVKQAKLPPPPPPPPPAVQAEEKTEPKPPSPRTVGLVIGGVIILVLGGLAYILFLDPFGLFNQAEPARAEAPAATTPVAATPAQPTPVAPAPTQQAATAATPEPLPPAEAEFKMPPPAPLAAGEEIAPGVVRLPPDAAAVSELPAPRSYEPPAPKPNPAYAALVNNLNISGIRPNNSGGFLMVGTLLYRPGDIVDPQSKLEFVSIEGQVITFKDPAGALYTRRF